MSTLLTHAELLALSRPVEPRKRGIYFLIRSGAVVYIGQSAHIMGRISIHAGEGKAFDAWCYVPMEGSMDAAERAYIDALDPELNDDPITRRRRGLPSAATVGRRRIKTGAPQ